MKKSQKEKRSHSTSHSKNKTLKGIIRLTSKGLGFVEIEGEKEDIMIERENLNTALHKDEVEIEILHSHSPASRTRHPLSGRGGGRGKREQRTAGKVVKILSRAKYQFVGTLETEKDRLFLVPDSTKMYTDILISKSDVAGAKNGIKALVRITGWPNPKGNPEGEIVKIIGEKGIHDVEMASIVLETGFDTEFPPEVEREAEAVAQKQASGIPPAELAKRRDFRNMLTFTIDPVDAKDFDDAISFKKLPSGDFEIGVHIADVSHYVREKTALDREAQKRGFSVYLVDRTIPMLPEALSNIVCSLNPDEDRLTFSSVFVMDKNGTVKERWFGKTVIHSAKRFTYEEAQEILNLKPLPLSKGEIERGSNTHSPSVPLLERVEGRKEELAEALRTLNSIAKKLREKKFKEGAIDFEQDEVRFELDPLGKPVRIYKKQRLDTHKLVEEYMLLANREVAEFIYRARERGKSNEPFIYRIHDLPDREKIAELGIFLRALGHDLPSTGGKVSAKDLQMLFKKIEGRAEEGMIKTAAVRSMAKAVYSTANIGHFGLAFEYYTHFTSPIRRYADLLVHRILFHHLSGTKIPAQEWQSYEKMARENSEQEIAAAEAERNSKKYKQVEYMQEKVGQTFEGIISGVTDWGMYIEEKDTRSEGMVKLRDMGDDYFILDEKNYCVVGEKTGKKYSLGDAVRFKVSAADLERKTLDYTLV